MRLAHVRVLLSSDNCARSCCIFVCRCLAISHIQFRVDHDWDNLRYFLALYRSETVALAARLLDVNEITVRRRIARLEENFSQPLFERVDGLHKVTTAGRELVEAAQVVESAVEHARERLSGHDTAPYGHVRVGAPDGVGNRVVAPALAKLQLSLPELTIELVTLPRQADLARREVDVAIVPMRPQGGGEHRIRAIKPIAIRLYGSRSYLEAHAPIRSTSDLASHRLVGYSSNADFREPLNGIAKQLGISNQASFSSMNILVQAQAVAHGAGLALLPIYAAESHPDLMVVLPDEILAHLPLWLMIHKEMAGLPRVRAVVAAIIRALAQRESARLRTH